MCGIVGFVYGITILNALKRLENRGYDSAGICTFRNNSLHVVKYASTENASAIDLILLEKLNLSDVTIGHTRWATHGCKSKINAHPHVSNNGKFVIVHNGIISNYLKLKEFLKSKNYTFSSNTDTEVIVNLVQYYYNDSIESTVVNINKLLEGTWAFLIMSVENNIPIMCATKYQSPLLMSEHGNFSSEISGLHCNDTKYYFIKDYEVLISTRNIDNFPFIEIEKSYIFPELYKSHWTLQEIYEQQESCLRSIIIDGRVDKYGMVQLEGLNNNRQTLTNMKHLYLIGCGTSYNACLFAKVYFQSFFNTVHVIHSHEISHFDFNNKNTLAILVSQSGETRDTYKCIELCNDCNVFTLGVVNVKNSLIARSVNCGCYTNVGKEIGVAATKSFTGQIIVLFLIAMWFSNKTLKNLNIHNHIKTAITYHDFIKTNIIPQLKGCNSCFLLGKNQYFALAREGALKIKELAYIHAEAYELGELKHGPFALLTPETPVILLGENIENTKSQIESRGAKIILINTNNYGGTEFSLVVILQLIAYELALARNINPDKPRNLAKTVTVD